MDEVQSPVTDINQQEMEELETMENEFQQTLSQWGQLHTSVVGSLTNLPATYSACIEACGSPTTSDVDLVNACKYGCNIGKYTGQDSEGRYKAGNVRPGYHNAPVPVRKFKPNPSQAAMAQGPMYHALLKKVESAQQINPGMTQTELNSLWKEYYLTACADAIGNDPVLGESGIVLGVQNGTDDNNSTNCTNNNVTGCQTCANCWAQGPGYWCRNTGQCVNIQNTKHCSDGSVPGNCENLETNMAGPLTAMQRRTRYCSGWQSTGGGMSGFYGAGENGSFTPMSSAADCDATIDSDESGYCTCIDGRKVGFVDTGHAAFTCNDLCSPQNKNALGVVSSGESGQPDQPLYNNAANWQKEIPCPSQGSGDEGQYCVARPGYPMTVDEDDANQTALCNAIGGGGCCTWTEHPIYPNQCVRTGNTFCSGKKDTYETYSGNLFSDEETTTTVDWGGGYCPTQPTANAPAATYQNNITSENIVPLPTTSQLIQQCEDQMAAFGSPELGPTFGTLYSDILALGQIEQKMEQQAEAIYAKIKSSSTTRNQVALTRSSAGQRLLKHLDTYEKIYRRLHTTEQKELNMMARAEDANLKAGSGKITYIVWFILAISSMFLVIKHLRK